MSRSEIAACITHPLSTMDNQQIETAARHACKLLGLDPDGPTPTRQTVGRYLTEWEILAPKVREQWAILEGIDLVGRQTWGMPVKG